MIAIDTSQIDSFLRSLDLAMLEFDQQISTAFEGWTKTIFKDIAINSPQWSGDLSANWTYAIGYADESYSPIPNKIENDQHWSKADVFQRGAYPAVGIALEKLTSVKPTWRDTVWIANNTPIAGQVEAQTVKIRPVNLVMGQVAMIQYAVDQIEGGKYVP